jgi:hypothetical protein
VATGTHATRKTTNEAEASVGQRLLWLLQHYRGRGGALNVPMVWRIRGELDADALQAALNDLVARHEVLRSTYRSQGRRLRSVIHPPAELPIAREDVTGEPDPEAAAIAAMREEAATGIDPTDWPTRSRMWRIAADDHLFFLNIHHLASDASSNRLLSRDMTLLYDRAMGLEVKLPEVDWQYADWAAWQREALAGPRLDRLKRYWSDKLTGAVPVALPQQEPSDSPSETVSNQERYDVEPELVEALRALARRNRTTLFPVTLAVFYVT